MENTQQAATARCKPLNKQVTYAGGCHIDGVPNTAVPLAVCFEDTAGSTCGALLPTGNEVDVDWWRSVTTDNGMPVGAKSPRFWPYWWRVREQLDDNLNLSNVWPTPASWANDESRRCSWAKCAENDTGERTSIWWWYFNANFIPIAAMRRLVYWAQWVSRECLHLEWRPQQSNLLKSK